MKKFYSSLLLTFIVTMLAQSQGWIVYDADSLPNAVTMGFSTSNVAGDPASNTLIDDPDNAGNKYLELISPGADPGKFMWRKTFVNDVDDSVTLVMRLKGVSSDYDRVMEVDLQQAGFRERLYIYKNNTFKLQEASVTGSLSGNVLDWHIYRLTKINDSVNFYFDENPTPFASVKTPTTSAENYFRFGDGNGSSTLGGNIDWIIWDTTGAYAPDAGAVLPDTLIATTPIWKVYAGNEIPLDSDPAFVESNTGGSADTNTFNTIIPDPDNTGNNLLKQETTVEAAKYMYRYTFPVNPTGSLTLVARIKGTSADLNRVMELDLDHGGFRERLYINTANTYRLNESATSGNLNAGVLGWHIYRLTKVADSVNFYLDENPEPVATVITSSVSATNNYFRFGDGNGSTTLGAVTDWIIWDETGAYAPQRGNFIPDSLITLTASSDNSLSALELTPGTLDKAFHPDTLEYTLDVAYGTDSLLIAATPSNVNANVTGTGKIEIPSNDTILVEVESEDLLVRSYTIQVNELPASTDADLASLSVDGQTLVPVFDPAVLAYTVETPAGTASVHISATVSDINATVADTGTFATIPGTATITVTAEDGTTTKEYTITVSKLSGIETVTPENEIDVLPNPFGDVLRIQSLTLITDVTIYDLTGAEVLRKRNIDNKTVEISAVQLNPGIYFIRVTNKNGFYIGKITKE